MSETNPVILEARAMIQDAREAWLTEMRAAMAETSAWAEGAVSAMGEVGPHELSAALVRVLAEKLDVGR